MNGRPPRYTPELAENILQKLASGGRLVAICKEPGMPSPDTVQGWVTDNIEGFAARYHEACEIGAALIRYPTLFTDEISERITAELTSGRTVDDLSKDPGMPAASTIRRWVAANHEQFTARFREAQEIGRALSGGPVPYSPEVADRIIGELMGGLLLIEVCELPGMPCVATVLLWVQRDHDGFAARYKEARAIGSHIMMDQLIKIGDDVARGSNTPGQANPTSQLAVRREDVDLAKVRIESRQWVLSRVLPRFFGNRLQIETRHDAGEGWAELLKELDGKTLRLPSEDETTDES